LKLACVAFETINLLCREIVELGFIIVGVSKKKNGNEFSKKH